MYTSIMGPLILVLVSAAALAPVVVRLGLRALLPSRRVGHRCRSCGFSLVGLPVEIVRCPECGAQRLAPDSRVPTTAQARLKSGLVAAMLSLPFLVLLAGILALTLGMTWITALQRVGLARAWPWAGGQSTETNTNAEVIRAFASGAGNTADLQAVIDRMYAARTREVPVYLPSHQDSPLRRAAISLGMGEANGLDDEALAKALANPTLPADRFDALLSNMLAASEKHPLRSGCQADRALWKMITGDSARVLTDSRLRQLAQSYIRIQADFPRPWFNIWGLFIERAFDRGLLREEEIQSYLLHAANPVMVLLEGDTPLAGDLVVFQIVPRTREYWGLPGAVRVADVRGVDPSRVCMISAPRMTFTGPSRGGSPISGYLCLPDQPGPLQIEVDLELAYGPAVVKADQDWHNSDDDQLSAVWKKMPSVIARHTVRADLQLRRSQTPRTREDASDITSQEMSRRIELWRVQWSPTNLGPRIYVSLNVGRAGVPLAFAASAMQDGQEYQLGWACTETGWPGWMYFSALTPGLNPTRPFDLSLRSDTGRLERPVWIPTVWQGSLLMPVTNAAEVEELFDFVH